MWVSETIRDAAQKVLKSAGGFVVFDDGNELEYVQFSKERDGLMMMWPARGPRVPAGEDVQLLLESIGFSKGDEVRNVENFTTAAFERVYGRLGLQKLNARADI